MFICFHVSGYVHSMLDSFSRRHQKLSGTEWMATAQNWNKSLRRLKYCTRAVGQEDLVWCTKSQPHLCIFTSASVWSSPHSHSFTSDTVQLGLFLQNSAKALFSISSPQEKLKTMSGNGHWIRPTHCDEAGRNLSDVWPSTFISGAVQLRSVTEIAPKPPFLSMKRSPFRYCFRIGARANTHSASKASEDFKDANSASQGSHPPWNSSKFDHY